MRGRDWLVLLGFLSPALKTSLWVMITLSIVSAFLDVLSIGLFIPFVSLMVDPDGLLSGLSSIAMSENLLSHLPPIEQLTKFIMVIFVVTLCFAIFIRLLLMYLSAAFCRDLGNRLTQAALQGYFSRPYILSKLDNSSRIITVVSTKVHAVVYSVVQPAMSVIQSAVALGIIILAAVLVNPILISGIAVSLGVMYGGLFLSLKSMIRAKSAIIYSQSAETVRLMHESKSGLRDLLMSGQYIAQIEKIRAVDLKRRSAEFVLFVLANSPRFLIEIIVVIGLGFVLLNIAESDNRSFYLAIGAGVVLAVQRTLPLFQQLYGALSNMHGAKIAFDSVFEFIEFGHRRTFEPCKKNRIDSIESIRIEGLSYSYPDSEHPVFENVDFQVLKGERVALIGSSGLGKSTLLDIILGLIEPSAGSFKVNGIDRDSIDMESYRRQFSLTAQDVFISDASIAENVSMQADTPVDVEKIRECLEVVDLESKVELLSEGLNTWLGESGGLMSGGQKQRVALARALYADSDVVVLDEATSSLNQQLKEVVIRNVFNYLRNRMCIFVTHDTGSLDLFDKVYAFDKSRSGIVVLKELSR